MPFTDAFSKAGIALERLLDPYFDESTAAKNLFSQFCWSPFERTIPYITTLLREGIIIRHARDWHDRTLLHVAVMRSNLGIIELLCQRVEKEAGERKQGKDYFINFINAKDKLGFTALQYAAFIRNPDARVSMMRFLIEQGADITIKNIRGHTVIDSLFILWDVGCITTQDYNTALGLVRGTVEPLNNIVTWESPAFILFEGQENQRIPYWCTPTLYGRFCASKPDFAAIAYILSKRIDIQHVRGEKNRTLLHVAVMRSNLKIIELLCRRVEKEAGEKKQGKNYLTDFINAQDERGFTALHYAAFIKNADARMGMMRLLIEQGAEIAIQNKRGHTVIDSLFILWYASCITTQEYNEALGLLDTKVAIGSFGDTLDWEVPEFMLFGEKTPYWFVRESVPMSRPEPIRWSSTTSLFSVVDNGTLGNLTAQNVSKLPGVTKEEDDFIEVMSNATTTETIETEGLYALARHKLCAQLSHQSPRGSNSALSFFNSKPPSEYACSADSEDEESDDFTVSQPAL